MDTCSTFGGSLGIWTLRKQTLIIRDVIRGYKMIGKYFKKTLSLLLYWIILAAFLFISQMSLMHEVQGAQIVDRIVAVVNDEIISLYELNKLAKPYTAKIRAARYSYEQERKMLFQVKAELLNELINQKLADQQLKRHNITVDETEIDKLIERIKEGAFLTDEEMRAKLASQGLTMEEFRKRTKEQLLRRKLLNIEIRSKIVITQDDIKTYYENHIDEYAGEKKYHLRNIIMAIPSGAGEAEKLAIYKIMESILTELEQGKDFASMAKMYSQSSLASEGGDLGFFRLRELSPVLRAEIANLKIGEFTPVLDTEMGYQILFVEEISETPGKSLEDATPEIRDKLYSEIVDKKYRLWLEELRSRSHIKIIN
jgi:peptidyl-prolyl cis-trans isomerase SurA